MRYVLPLLLAASAIGCVEAAGLTLASDGQPRATLFMAAKPTRAAQFAAAELREHVRQITGAELPIRTEGDPIDGVPIYLGDTAAARRLGLAADGFAPQEYVVRITGGGVVLAGRDKADYGEVAYTTTPTDAEVATWPGIWDERGTLHAVYDFLERYCGVRWLTASDVGTDCPRQPTLTLPATPPDVRRAPYFRYRYAHYPPSESWDQYTGLWRAGSEGQVRYEAAAFADLHRRFPEADRYRQAKRGWVTLYRLRRREGGEICLGNHSLYGYYRRFWEPEAGQEKLFEAKHADWFAQGYAGRPPQMCYSSRGLIEQVAKDACEFFESGRHYQGDQAGGDSFCVEPMDNDAFCQCAPCRAWLGGRDADSPFFSNGRHSDYFFQFVNEVAKIVGAKHPDKKIVCLAYMTHAAPPVKVTLAPNVLVQYCFSCNRLNFDRASYEHEESLLRAWRRTNPQRPLYLWLYDTFPVEIANGGQFHCFPGFFAQAIGEQFKLFREQNYRGMFHCGYGQDLEAYLTYRLMDDPSLPLEPLLADYFQRLYGPAAATMRRVYETIEQTYSNPANYPANIASGKIEGHHHQTEEVAWGYLGTEARMATLTGLMAQAQAMTLAPEQARRVELFRLGIIDYMVAGREQYLAKIKARASGGQGPLRVPYASGGPLAGDAGRMVRGEAAGLFGWRSRQAEPTRRTVAGWLINDGQHLLLQLEDQAAPAKGDSWQVLLAESRQAPLRQLTVSADGKLTATNAGQPWDSGALVRSEPTAKAWRVSLALPLAKLPPTLWLNVARRSTASTDQPMWNPSFAAIDDPAGLRELRLDTAASLPTGLPTAEELRRTESQDLVARWRLGEARGTEIAATGPTRWPGSLTNKAAWVTDGGRPVVRLDESRRQFIDLGSPPEADLTGALTLWCWVKYEPTDTWYPALLGKGYEASGTYGMHIRPGNTVWFEIDSPDGQRHTHNPTERSLTPGEWNLVTATYDGATMRVYVNGREAGNGLPVATTIRTNREPLRFGWLGSYGFFNGCVRDLAVYRRAMPAGEVFARYLAGQAASH